jgi:hypothetical protein
MAIVPTVAYVGSGFYGKQSFSSAPPRSSSVLKGNKKHCCLPDGLRHPRQTGLRHPINGHHQSSVHHNNSWWHFPACWRSNFSCLSESVDREIHFNTWSSHLGLKGFTLTGAHSSLNFFQRPPMRPHYGASPPAVNVEARLLNAQRHPPYCEHVPQRRHR